MTKKCRDCGKEFTLTDGEIDFYNSKGLNLPSRCEECRKKRKNAKAGSQSRNISDKTLSKSAEASKTPTSKQKNKFSNSQVAVLLIALVLIFAVSVILPKMTDNETENAVISITSVEETESVTSSETKATIETESTESSVVTDNEEKIYCFRNEKLKREHYEKHGIEMGFSSADEYEAAACDVVNNADALHKYEKEDGDDVYYLESTNDFVIVSTDGYIRTYFRPEKGKDYFDRQ